MSNFYEEYTKALVSVDCIIFGMDNNKLHLLLGKRQMDPGRGQWSLYGGFVAPTENLDEAATRVLISLTGIQNIYMRQVGAYGAVNRDPGSRVISVAYCALINVKDYSEKLRKKHKLSWVQLDQLPMLYSDHKEMVDNALQLLRQRIDFEPLGFSLLPQLFTLTQLQTVYEAILGKELDKRNFRKRCKQSTAIEETEFIDRVSSKRGAVMYRRNMDVEFNF